MTKKILLGLVCFTLIGGPITAQQISDVKKSDGAYSSIKKSVKNGYLSLFQGNEFAPDRSITRKEMAVIIDKILVESDESKLNLSAEEISQLTTLSQSFKGYVEGSETKLNKISGEYGKLEDEQKVLHHDISQLNESLKDEVTRLKAENKQAQLYMWIGIGAAAILGVAI